MKNLEGIEVSCYTIHWNTADYDVPASKFTKALEQIYWFGVPGFELQNAVSYGDEEVPYIAINLTSPDDETVRDWMYATAKDLGAKPDDLWLGGYKAVNAAGGVLQLCRFAF